jgi:hypothetical protein
MRTIFTLLTAIVFSLVAKAADEGRLTINFSGSGNLYVQVDGRYYTVADNSVCIDPIVAGRHTVRVFQQRNGGNGNGRQLYSGQVMVRPSVHVDITFNRFGKAFTDERRYGGIVYSDYDSWGNTECGSSVGNGNGGWGNGNGGWNGANAPMSGSNFSALLAQVRAESFDNTKLTLARDALSMNYVTVEQAKQLVQLFSFDSDRLAMAKAAYPRTVDKNNFFQVMDAFEFSSSKEQLSAWIRTQ